MAAVADRTPLGRTTEHFPSRRYIMICGGSGGGQFQRMQRVRDESFKEDVEDVCREREGGVG